LIERAGISGSITGAGLVLKKQPQQRQSKKEQYDKLDYKEKEMDDKDDSYSFDYTQI
jgi:hypothetical protein